MGIHQLQLRTEGTTTLSSALVAVAPDLRVLALLVAWSLAALVSFLVPYTLLWFFVGPELPTIAGALFGGMVFLLLFRLFGSGGSNKATGSNLKKHDAGQSLRAASPYLVVIALVLVTRLIPSLRQTLQSLSVDWSLHEVFFGSIQPLSHPAE